ncbi:MAG: hypothetical protein JW821_02670 [Deltaproteobacteria bacterium]|nr:hypothetical protein [Deltaproteobacteria bacterium]
MFMGWLFRKKHERGLKEEAKIIEAEISRSKRFGFQFGVLTVEISHRVPRGLSKVLPGRTMSFYVLQKSVRLYDQVIESELRRKYYIILPQTNRDGVEVVKTRIYRIAQEQHWGSVSMKSAVYPEDGENFMALLDKCSR